MYANVGYHLSLRAECVSVSVSEWSVCVAPEAIMAKGQNQMVEHTCLAVAHYVGNFTSNIMEELGS